MFNFRKILILAPATLLPALIGCTSIETTAYEGCPASITRFHECERFKETQLLREKPSLGVRQGDRLEIRLTNGESLVLVDVRGNKAPPEGSIGFNLVKDFPDLPYVLVTSSSRKGGDYYLVNLITGYRTLIVGEAMLSPDMKYFIAWRGHDQHASSGLQAYQISPEGLTLEYELKAKNWWLEQVRWQDELTLAFDQAFLLKTNKVHKAPILLRIPGWKWERLSPY